MKAWFILFIAALFAWWFIRQEEDPEIWRNVIFALNFAYLFILLCLGVFELCSCVM